MLEPESSLPSKKRGRASPPRQRSFLSSEQMTERFGTADLLSTDFDSVGPEINNDIRLEEVSTHIFKNLCDQNIQTSAPKLPSGTCEETANEKITDGEKEGLGRGTRRH